MKSAEMASPPERTGRLLLQLVNRFLLIFPVAELAEVFEAAALLGQVGIARRGCAGDNAACACAAGASAYIPAAVVPAAAPGRTCSASANIVTRRKAAVTRR